MPKVEDSAGQVKIVVGRGGNGAKKRRVSNALKTIKSNKGAVANANNVAALRGVVKELLERQEYLYILIEQLLDG